MNNELQDGCFKNVPVQYDGIVPKDDLVHTFMYRKRISKKKIEEPAVQKYPKCGKDIDFKDVVREFGLKIYLLIKDSFTFNFILLYRVLLRSTIDDRNISYIVKFKSIDWCMSVCIHDDLIEACSKCLVQSILARASFLIDNAK